MPCLQKVPRASTRFVTGSISSIRTVANQSKIKQFAFVPATSSESAEHATECKEIKIIDSLIDGTSPS
jgi:hypothetical protein